MVFVLEGCGYLRFWSLASGRVIPITAEVVDCPPDGEGFYGPQVAVVGEEVVWSAFQETNHLSGGIAVAASSRPGVARRLHDAEDEGIGALDADGDVVAFSTQQGSYGVAGAGARLWVGTTRRVSVIRSITGWMDRVAVDGDLVAVGYRNGRVEVFRKSGARVAVFPPGTAVAGVAIDRRRLVAVDRRVLSVRDLDTGRRMLSRPLRGAGGGTVLLDVRAGLVAYRASAELRLLRLSDGRDVRLPAPGAPSGSLHARFGARGLVVAHPGVVKLLVWSRLERLFATG